MKGLINYIKERYRSLSFACEGFRFLYKDEANFRIQAILSVITIIAGIIFKISLNEWIAVIIAIGLVLILEIVNTTIENIADLISLETNLLIKKTKDIAASGVLLSSIIAFLIGLIVFIPKIGELF